MYSKITLFLLFSTQFGYGQPSSNDIEKVLSVINELRERGCKCGDQWMSPVGPVSWDNALYTVSNKYARYMAVNRHFDHISKEGEDLGDRLNKVNYPWVKIGENLAYGYHDFFSVLKAWKKSPSHCRMLMDPDVTNMGLSKHRIYWVQSFSKSITDLTAASSY